MKKNKIILALCLSLFWLTQANASTTELSTACSEGTVISVTKKVGTSDSTFLCSVRSAISTSIKKVQQNGTSSTVKTLALQSSSSPNVYYSTIGGDGYSFIFAFYQKSGGTNYFTQLMYIKSDGTFIDIGEYPSVATLSHFFNIFLNNTGEIGISGQRYSTAGAYIGGDYYVSTNASLFSLGVGTTKEHIQILPSGGAIQNRQTNNTTPFVQALFKWTWSADIGAMISTPWVVLAPPAVSQARDITNRSYMETALGDFYLVVGTEWGASTINAVRQEDGTLLYNQYNDILIPNVYGTGTLGSVGYGGQDYYNGQPLVAITSGGSYIYSSGSIIYVDTEGVTEIGYTPPVIPGGDGSGVLDTEWDADGDGSVSITEFVSGVGQSIAGFFGSVGDIFAGFGDLFSTIAKIGDTGTGQADLFGWIIPGAHASDLTDSMQNIDSEDAGFLPRLIRFFLWVGILVLIISSLLLLKK